MAVSIEVKDELANEAVNYGADYKAYQFEPEVLVIKKGIPGERTCLTRVFEESPKEKPVQLSAINIRFNWKKVFAAVKTSNSVTNLPRTGSYGFFLSFWTFCYLNFAMPKCFFRETCFIVFLSQVVQYVK